MEMGQTEGGEAGLTLLLYEFGEILADGSGDVWYRRRIHRRDLSVFIVQ